MTENRKQELARLLHEAVANLEIQLRPANRSQLVTIDLHEYRRDLQESWTSHSLNSASMVMRYEINITNDAIKSKLLDLIREEFDQFIHEDRIRSVCLFIGGGPTGGYSLDCLLEQLLKIAIVHGIERAISDFDRCTENRHAPFQHIALLEGIRVEAEIQVFEGVRLVPLPTSGSELSNYLPDTVFFNMPAYSLLGKTLLIIDAFMSPIFHKPLHNQFHEDDFPFQIGVTGWKSPKFEIGDFHKKFCQALSFVCNSAVQISLEWRFLAKDLLFNWSTLGTSGFTCYNNNIDRFGRLATIGEGQIDEAKSRYEILDNFASDVATKLQIPIDRWIKSKTNQNTVDKVIDLGIAFEALYLSETNYNREIRFRFSLHAAWHLEKCKGKRKALMKKFKTIYDKRSEAVHTGKLPKAVKIGKGQFVSISEFITEAQDLCRKSIMKILEDGKFPDWNDLILGE